MQAAYIGRVGEEITEEHRAEMEVFTNYAFAIYKMADTHGISSEQLAALCGLAVKFKAATEGGRDHKETLGADQLAFVFKCSCEAAILPAGAKV
jgi:hypothetical protein